MHLLWVFKPDSTYAYSFFFAIALQNKQLKNTLSSVWNTNVLLNCDQVLTLFALSMLKF